MTSTMSDKNSSEKRHAKKQKAIHRHSEVTHILKLAGKDLKQLLSTWSKS